MPTINCGPSPPACSQPDPYRCRPAPKHWQANTNYRRAIADRARKDEGFRRACWDRAKDDIIWYSDTFLSTYNPKSFKTHAVRSFILYDFQEDAIRQLVRAIGRNDVLIEKSRDMGASWINLLVFEWRWHFFPLQSFLLGSRKEEYVDKTGDPKCLFWKILFLLQKQPLWMRPKYERTKLHILNIDNGSSIDGESTNQDFATGDRRTAILLDEFSLVENGQAILTATRDVTDCRIFNATPKGARGAYYQQKKQIERADKKNKTKNIVRMHWSQHPMKARGLYTTIDGRIELLDKNFDWKKHYPKGYDFVLNDGPEEQGKVRSPWYDRQCEREPNKKSIAQELDINYHESGWGYFEDRKLDDYIEKYCIRPFHRGDIDGDVKGNVWFNENKHGPLRLWVQMGPGGTFHFDNDDFIVACDIATGKSGKKSSNSVVVVYNRRTKTKVAQFWSNAITPTEFAQYCLLLCKFFKGKTGKPAYLIWEDNGPGGEFAKEIANNRYVNVFCRREETIVGKTASQTPGWWSGKREKRMLLSEYSKQIMAGSITNYCEEAMKECREYEQDPMGNIYHVGSLDEDDSDYGENHGDMVIADALACRAMNEWQEVDRKATEAEPPPGSPAYRRKKRETEAREKARAERW